MRGEVDDAVAHYPAGQQRVGGDGKVEIADLIGRDPVFPAGAGNLRLQFRVPPDVEGVDDDADGARVGYGAARSRAWPRVEIRARSAAYIGCSGSSTRRTPFSAANGTRSARRSATRRRAATHVLFARGPVRRPPGTAPGAESRCLEDGRPVVGQRRCLALPSAAVRNPPRQSEDTRRPASLDQPGGLVQPGVGDQVPPGADRGDPARTPRRPPRPGSISWWWRVFRDSREKGSAIAHPPTPLNSTGNRTSGTRPGPGSLEQSGLVGQLEGLRQMRPPSGRNAARPPSGSPAVAR